ncbi:hypothetical protein [Trinickia sp. EG282A]|uniref:hypothetical protein n=1 Tax=Trinickia sp. EG282A TaxID=3237013 RepID=UPI0034D2D0E4
MKIGNQKAAPIAWNPGRFVLPGDDVSLNALYLRPVYFTTAIRETDRLFKSLIRGY